jgi:cellulose synthase/poly-beta-1,6-N-acetylglucosamine synthase-like glycosyltransferase
MALLTNLWPIAANIALLSIGYQIVMLMLLLKAFDVKRNLNQILTKIQDVSIIVCARNNYPNLTNHINLWKNQKAVNTELVIVDDQSDDDTMSLRNKQGIVYKRIEAKTSPGKKAALRLGHQSASNDWFLLTDADCQPASDAWASLMLNTAATQNKNIVLGLSPYRNLNRPLDAAVQYDTFITALHYTSAARFGMPYMSVGRNVLYHKDVAAAANWSANQDLASGDDDLLLQPLLKNYRVGVQTDPDAQTWSDPPATWPAWLRQKSRHLSTAPRYEIKTKILLLLWSLTHAVAVLSLLLALLMSNGVVVLAAFLLRSCLIILLWWLTTSQWKFPINLIGVLLADLLWPVYYLYQGVLMVLGGKRGRW